MATDSFNSAGADASQGILGFLAALDAQKRQKRLDDLTAQQQGFDQHIKLRDIALKESKEQREAEQHKADLAERASQHATQAEQITENIRAKKAQGVEKTLGNMGPGDYPDSQLIQDMDAVGMGSLAPKPPVTQQSAPGLVAPNASAVPGGMRVAPAPNEPPAQMGLTGAADPMVRPYVGSPAQRDKIAMRGQQQALIDSLPEGDPRKDEIRQSLQAEAAGLKVPPGFFAKQGQDGRQLILDSDTGTFKDSTGQPVTNPSKADTVHVLPRKPDHSMADVTHDMEKRRFIQSERDKALTLLETKSKPFEETINNSGKLLDTLAQGTNVADATLASQVVKLAEGGMGSGVRIQQPVIDAVEHRSRTRWADLVQKAKQFDSDGRITYTADQLAAITDLAHALRAHAVAIHKKISSAKDSIIGAQSEDDINRVRRSAISDLFTPDDETGSAAAPSGFPAGVTVRKVK